MLETLKNLITPSERQQQLHDDERAETTRLKGRQELRARDSGARDAHAQRLQCPSETDLAVPARASRKKALAACVGHYKAEHADRERELRDELATIQRMRDGKISAAHAEERDAHNALQRAFVADFYETAKPMVQLFTEEASRKQAANVLKLIKLFDEREEAQLGLRGHPHTLAVELLCFLFVDEIVRDTPSVAREVGSLYDGDNSPFGYYEAVSRVRDAKSAAEMMDALESLEITLGRIVSRCKDMPVIQRSLDRYAHVRLLDAEALEAFDRGHEQKRLAAANAATDAPDRAVDAAAANYRRIM